MNTQFALVLKETNRLLGAGGLLWVPSVLEGYRVLTGAAHPPTVSLHFWLPGPESAPPFEEH